LAIILRSFGTTDELRLPHEVLPFAARFIFDLFELEFGKTKSRGIGRLVIRFTSDPSRHLQCEDLVDVLVVDYFFDEALFSRLDVAGKKRFFLDSIWNALDRYADAYGWDRAHCRAVYQRVLDGGIVFDRWWGKPARARPRGRIAQAHVAYFDCIRLSLGAFTAERTLIAQVLIAVLPPTVGAITAAIGKLEWPDGDRVRLWHSNARDYWDWHLASGRVEFHYPRAERGDAHGEYDLGRMYLEGDLVAQDRAQAIAWLERSAAQGYKHAHQLLKKIGGSASGGLFPAEPGESR
jgi:hypothetical protein